MGEKTACGKSTQDLLLEFQQTGSQAPFEEIARRYAGMVYNVALQVTKDAHDAEDATQATFLTLAVHAKTAGKIRFVGPWLRKVSQRLALDIRRSKKRRSNREQRHAITHAAANGNGVDGTVSRHDLTIANSLQLEELRDILRNELDRLPTKYRMPLILYYFGGLTPEQIGQELKCKTSTLGVRLHRGRKMLAENLSNRGITINSATAGLMLAAMVDSSIRDNLVHACTHAAVQVAGNRFIADATISAPVLAMAHSVTSAIRLSRLKGLIAAGVLLLSTLTGAAAALERFDFIKPETLKLLNPLRLIRPLMDRLLRPVSFSIDYSPAGKTEPLPRELLASGSTLPGTLWGSSTVSPWPSPPAFVQGDVAHVGSERVLPSQFPISESFTGGPLLATAAHSALIVPQAIAPIVASPVTQNTEPGFTAATPESVIPTTPLPPLAHAPSHLHDVLVIDRSNGATSVINGSAVLFLDSGSIQARQLIVGDSTEGTVIQTGNSTVTVTEGVVIANKPTSTGTYSISGESTLNTPTLVVGAAGSGTMIQGGGVVSTRSLHYDGSVVIGEEADSEGTYVLKGGLLTTDRLVVGRLGVGSLLQSGGEINFQVAQLGEGASGRGTWVLDGGSVQVTDSATPTPTTPTTPALSGGVPVVTSAIPAIPAATFSSQNPLILVGGLGTGTILMNSVNGTTIGEPEGSRGATVYVRPDAAGMGVIRGHGRIELSGPFISNGKVIADGFGTPRVLDLSGVPTVTNVLDNPAGGANGWYARNGGSLKLPVIRVYGAKAYTWGEFQFDHQIDLVNSVRFTPHGDVIGEVDITLLDPMSRAVPKLLDESHAMSLWSFAATFEVTDVDLLVRYDDLMATMWRISENDLALWSFQEGQWQKLTGEYAGIDLDANLVWGRAQNPRFFAVGPSANNLTPLVSASPSVAITPEPTTVTALALIAGTALMRRRRR